MQTASGYIKHCQQTTACLQIKSVIFAQL